MEARCAAFSRRPSSVHCHKVIAPSMLLVSKYLSSALRESETIPSECSSVQDCFVSNLSKSNTSTEPEARPATMPCFVHTSCHTACSSPADGGAISHSSKYCSMTKTSNTRPTGQVSPTYLHCFTTPSGFTSFVQHVFRRDRGTHRATRYSACAAVELFCAANNDTHA